jgi:membrane protease subunit HflC
MNREPGQGIRLTSIIQLILFIFVLVVAGSSIYTVEEGKQVVITQFRKPVKAVTEAGPHFRIPFIQEINELEKRIMPWDGAPENMQTRDKQPIFIDVWARWRIVDPMKHYEVAGTVGGEKILDDLVDSAVRDVVAGSPLIEAIRSTNDELVYESEELSRDAAGKQEQLTDADAEGRMGRGKLEAVILAKVRGGNRLEETYGMELIEVRIKRIDYTDTVRRTVYDRMKSERIRIAQLFESEGIEEQNRILGIMQKELDGIEGEAKQKSTEIRGAADAEVIQIAAEAFSKSPEFYQFLRQLEAYKVALAAGTNLILSTDNEFFARFHGTQTPAIDPLPKNPSASPASPEKPKN